MRHLAVPQWHTGLVPVAGRSSRMGDFKPLMTLGDMTVIENTVLTLFEAGVESAVVVTGHRAIEVEDVLTRRFGNRVIAVRNDRFAETDMMESIRVGCRSLPLCDAFFLLPGDMPAIRPETLIALSNAWNHGTKVAFPTFGAKRCHPPLIAYDLVKDILGFTGDGGMRGFWNTCQDAVCEVAIDDEGMRIDLDYPCDYARCKALTGRWGAAPFGWKELSGGMN